MIDVDKITFRQWLIGQALASSPSDARNIECAERAIKIADETLELLEKENDSLSRRATRQA